VRIHFIENMTQRQIVDVLGMTPAFVSPRMRRAIVALKAMRDYGNTMGCAAAHFTTAYLRSDRAGSGPSPTNEEDVTWSPGIEPTR